MKLNLTLFALLLSASLAGSSEKFLPNQLILRLKEPLNIVKNERNYYSGNADFDRLLREAEAQSAEFPLHKFNHVFPSADKTLLLKLPSGKNLEQEISRFHRSQAVEWVAKHYIYELNFTPNDSLFADQYYLEQVNAPTGWDLAVGAEPVILGLIDSGVDYTHPDLAENIWLNPMEDNPPFGILDSADFDGIDNDLNGFVDDLVGWDFVDSPELPYGIDFLQTDNDPMDHFGHGTAVAGIIGAEVNNNIGIAGAATNVKIMPLRVTANGYLSEIALAQAVLYAVDPFPQNPTIAGAQVINLSIGSEQISPLLQDIIDYALEMDVVIVASAGNSGSIIPIYPSAYNQVLSVGAVDSEHQKITISNYGTALDITAPGVGMLSTLPGGNYGLFQGGTGTSFSAPLVSACAVMLRGVHPTWNAEQIKSAILGSTNDLYQIGWDSLSGQGELDIATALSIPYNLMVEISSPQYGSAFAGDTLNILGDVKGLYLKKYSLYWGLGNNPLGWNTIVENQNRQINNGLIGKMIFDSTFIDTIYTIKLHAEDQFGYSVEDYIVLDYVQQAPIISNIKILSALEGDFHSTIVTCHTDQFCLTSLYLTGVTVPQEFYYLYPDTNHIMTLNQNQVQGIYHLQIRASNLANLDTFSATYYDAVVLNQSPYNATYYDFKHDGVLPSGYILPLINDFDNDGAVEVFLQDYATDSLKLYENNDGVFQALDYSYALETPQDIGDSDGDGFLELLCNSLDGMRIYEQSTANNPPDSIIYFSAYGNFGLNLLNFDSTTGCGELFLRQDSVLVLYRHLSDGNLLLIDGIDTEHCVTKVERSEWGDFDHDDDIDVVFITDEGILSVFALNEDSLFTGIYQDTLTYPQGTFGGRFLNAGDFDGDSVMEFIAGDCSPVLPGEFGDNTGYWEFYIYDYVDTIGFYRAESLYFVGVDNPEAFAAGVSVGNCDNEPLNEILISLTPHLYLVEWADTTYKVTWHYEAVTTNQTLIHDVDNNGNVELIFNRGASFASFEAPAGINLPLPPANLVAIPQGPNVVKLYWSPVATVEFYEISRGSSRDSLVDITSARAIDSTYYDYDVVTDCTYYYSVSTYYNGQWSPRSIIVAGIPNSAPLLLYQSFNLEDARILRLEFSEEMSDEVLDRTKYTVSGGLAHPSSVALENDRKHALLTFNQPFISNSYYVLTLTPILDLQGCTLANLGPFDLLTPAFPQQLPYLIQASPTGDGILLEFSAPMNPDTSALIDRYNITYGQNNYLIITSAQPDTNDLRFISLEISPDTPMGPLGFIYTISVHDLYDISNNPINPLYASVTLAFATNSLNQVFAYPNPYRAGDIVDGEHCLVFANLMPQAEIRIFNLSGELVKKLVCDDTFGGVKWYLDNQKGELVGNGIYIYYVSADDEKFMGKVAIMR